MTRHDEQPEERQERQHRENVERLDKNVGKLDFNAILTTVFGLAIMGGLGIIYNKAEAITVLQTKIPYIEGKIDSLQIQQTANADAISRIPDLMEKNRKDIEADVLRNVKKYGQQPDNEQP